jgi:hypothetical protein
MDFVSKSMSTNLCSIKDWTTDEGSKTNAAQNCFLTKLIFFIVRANINHVTPG